MAILIVGIVNFIFLGALAALFHNTANLPNAMSARELDPLKRGLRLAFSSGKVILIILSSNFSTFGCVLIFARNIHTLKGYHIALGLLLSLIVFIPSFRKIRLNISLSFKISLIVLTGINLALLFLASEAPFALVASLGISLLIHYIRIEFAFQLVYPVHLMNVVIALSLLLTSTQLFFSCVNAFIVEEDDAIYYGGVGAFMALSLLLGLPVKTYFKPI